MDYYTTKRVEIKVISWHENKGVADIYHYHQEHAPWPFNAVRVA